MRIPKGIMQIARICPTDDEARMVYRSVNCKRLSDRKCRIQVTDGRSAIQADFMEPDSEFLPGFGVSEDPVDGFMQLVPSDAALAADKAVGGDARYSIIIEDSKDDLCRIVVPEATNIMFEGRSPSEVFPPLEDVMPDYRIICTSKAGFTGNTPAVRFCVSVDLLKSVLVAISNASNCDSVIIDAPLVPNRPLRIEGGDREHAHVIAAVMPREVEAGYGDPLDMKAAKKMKAEVQSEIDRASES